MKTTYEVRTGWIYLDKTFYNLEEARAYVEELKQKTKKPKIATIIKWEVEHEYIETTILDNGIHND